MSSLGEVIRFARRAALTACNGKIYGAEGAASMLGMKPTTLASRIKTLNITN
jgi:transcriptional regulator with GAF, ATPase, and Fis domain